MSEIGSPLFSFSTFPPKDRRRSAEEDQATNFSVLLIRDVYPGSRFFANPDPGSKNFNKREGFFCSNKFQKFENYFIFEMLKKKIRPSFQRIIELFTQKFVTSPKKIWVWDPGSGSRGQKGTGSGSATLQFLVPTDSRECSTLQFFIYLC
jgi:hypothetical protein